MLTQSQLNKQIVRRFNQEVIAEGNLASFQELLDEQFINHSAPPGADYGPQGMINTFNNILPPALADMRVIIHDQIAKGDLVPTRKTITGTHVGTLIDIPPTDRSVSIEVIDVVRIRDGKYIEHWGINTLPTVLQQLAKN